MNKILLIDDENITGDLFKFLLEGYDVEHKQSMKYAKEILDKSKNDFSLILLDLKLEPTNDWSIDKGFENIDFLKKNYPQIPIIAVSSVDNNEHYNIDYEIGHLGVAAPLLKKSNYNLSWKKYIEKVQRLEVAEDSQEKTIKEIIQKIELTEGYQNKDKERIDLLKQLKRISGRYVEFRYLQSSSSNDKKEAINLSHYIEIIDEPTTKKEELLKAYQIIEGYEQVFNDKEYSSLKSIAIQNEINFEKNIQEGIKLIKVSFPDVLFFDAFDWYPQSNMNIILGENGFGKSFFLRIVAALCQNDTKVLEDDLFSQIKYLQTPIEIEFERKNKALSLEYSKDVIDNRDVGKVPLLAIGSHRFLSNDGLLKANQHSDIVEEGAYNFLWSKIEADRFNNFLMLLYEFYQNGIEDLLFSMDRDKTAKSYYREQFIRQTKKEIDNKFQKHPCVLMFKKVMEHLSDEDDFEFVDFERKNSGTIDIKVKTNNTNGNTISIQRASSGQQSILAIFGLIYDFLYRLNLRKKDLDKSYKNEAITEEQGIVIIDEIDAHLHPKWQRKIVNLLRETFPNVQFILISHSDHIVAGCKEREVSIIIKKGNKLSLNQSKNHYVGALPTNIYRDVFGIREREDETYIRLQEKWRKLGISKDKFYEKIELLEKEITIKSDLKEIQLLNDELKEYKEIRLFLEARYNRNRALISR